MRKLQLHKPARLLRIRAAFCSRQAESMPAMWLVGELPKWPSWVQSSKNFQSASTYCSEMNRSKACGCCAAGYTNQNQMNSNACTWRAAGRPTKKIARDPLNNRKAFEAVYSVASCSWKPVLRRCSGKFSLSAPNSMPNSNR